MNSVCDSHMLIKHVVFFHRQRGNRKCAVWPVARTLSLWSGTLWKTSDFVVVNSATRQQVTVYLSELGLLPTFKPCNCTHTRQPAATSTSCTVSATRPQLHRPSHPIRPSALSLDPVPVLCSLSWLSHKDSVSLG